MGRSIGIFFRTLRAFFSRKLMSFVSILRRLTNFSRYATKAASASLQGVASAAQNPSKPSDYVETGKLLISKSLIIRIILILIALALIGYFVIWPFVLSHFLTAKFFVEDSRIPDWSGRVIVYSDKKKTVPLYAGRLEDGVLQGDCKLYDENGVLIYEGQLTNGERNGSGKAYENGVLVYDGRYTDEAYDGMGTLYEDGQIRYRGQYEKGKRSGNGKEYQNGELLYDGQFVNDLYEGRGKLYKDGNLVYDGQFVAGQYDGFGTLYENGKIVYSGHYDKGVRTDSGKAYQDGELVYDGEFQDDLYEGRGKLYSNGVLVYDGDFHAGKPEGTGTAYYDPSGKLAYQGDWKAGKRDGTGVAYNEDGSKLYEGGFAEDVYSGDGTLYFDDGGQISANFAEGVPTGSVEWKKNGFLYYSGEWADDVPNGFGTLYNKAGKKIYEGPFIGGTFDAGQLLGNTADAFRAVLSEGSVRNVIQKKGFLIIAEEAGLTALCSFRTDKEDSQVLKLFLSAPEKDDWVAVMPGMAHTAPVQWKENVYVMESLSDFKAQEGVNLKTGRYDAESTEIGDQRTTALYSDDSLTQAVLLIWENTELEPAALPSGGSGKSSSVKKLLDALTKMINRDGTIGDNGGSVKGTPVDEALAKAETADDAVALTDVLIDYWVLSQRLKALNEIYNRNEMLLSDEQTALGMGTGSRDRINELQKNKVQLNAQIDTTKTAMGWAEMQASSYGVTGLSDYALEELLLLFDPGKQDVSALAAFAFDYAQKTGSEETEEAIKNQVLQTLLNLSDAHTAAETALAEDQLLQQNVDSALNDYSMGVGTKAAWFDALDAEVLARVDLYDKVAAFSKTANHFNQLTGGWVCRTFNWHKDVFEPLLLAEILPDPTPEPTEEPTPTPTPTSEPTEDPSTDPSSEPSTEP